MGRVGKQFPYTAGGGVVGQVGRIQLTLLTLQLQGHPEHPGS